MTAPSFTYSGNVYTGAAAGTVDFALTSTTGNAIAYLEPSHIHVYKSSNQGVTWTELTRPSQWNFVTNGTVARLATGIAAGDWVKVQRITPSTSSYVTFQASSLLTAEQLNDDTLFNTYLNQERVDQSDQSTLTANTASTNAASAVSTANTALSTANAASASASAAVSTANTASTNASAAVATANTASTNASAAVSTANTASSNASAAVSTANTAASNAATALSTANTALTNSNNAVTTATNANTTAQAANTTATNAESIANSALSIVAGTVQFVPVANVAAIPASPSNDDAIQIQDSTGIQSFSPLTGLPAGFTGSPQLFVRIQYDTPGTTWQYVGYGANDPDNRYVIQGVLGTANNPSFYFDADTGIYSPGANEIGLSTGGTARLTIDSAGAVAIPGSLSVAGQAAVVTNDSRLSDTRTPTDNTVSTAKIVDGAVTSAKIADGTIVNADVNASAAIAGTKISPDFGSQNVTTTGTSTAASFIPTSSSAPTNGVYLPAANSVAISTNSTQRLLIDASSAGFSVPLGVGAAQPSDGHIRLSNTTTRAAGNKYGIRFADSSFETNASIYAEQGGSGNNASALVFATNSGTSGIGLTSASERLRITSAGLVGIGTSNPGAPLDVVGSANTVVLSDSATNATLKQAKIQCRHYTSSEENLMMIYAISDSSANEINIGGGSSAQNYATQIGFWTAANNTSTTGTERLRITSAGNVGIGTTSPAGTLHLASTYPLLYLTDTDATGAARSAIGCSDGNLVYYANENNQAGGNHIFYRNGANESARLDSSGRLLVGTSSTSANCRAVVQSTTSDTTNGAGILHLSMGSASPQTGWGLGTLCFSNSNQQIGAQIAAKGDSNWTAGTSQATRLEFSTTADGASSPTERMRISNNGAVLLSGPSANAVALAINSAVAGSSGGNYPLVTVTSTGAGDAGAACLHLGKYDNSTSTSNPFIRFYINNSGTGNGQINANGASAAAFGTFSDERLKENISELPSQLQNICALRPVEFDYKNGSGHQIGFIAQEMQTVYPDVVGETDGMLTITGWSKTEARLVKALQEAIGEIESLKARVAALESA